MIRTLLLGMARLVFNAAMLTAALALVLVYAAVRLVKASMRGTSPKPVREAGFAALVAAIVLVRAVAASRSTTTPEE